VRYLPRRLFAHCPSGPYLAYVAKGRGLLSDGQELADGGLVRGDDLRFEASDETQLIIGHLMPATG